MKSSTIFFTLNQIVLSIWIFLMCHTISSPTTTSIQKYMLLEHPAVVFYNPKYLSYANITSKRYGRHDSTYYVSINFEALDNFGNNVSVSVYFYEYLSNVYKRGFVEIHFSMCDIDRNNLIGQAIRGTPLDQRCPYPKGPYNLENMTIPSNFIPPGFPFRKGRIYLNLTYVSKKMKEDIGCGYIDMEIKERVVKRNK